jgi:hypothetical protein
LTFHANNSQYEISYEITVTVIAVPDTPGQVEITAPQHNTEINEGELLNFSSICHDPDLPYGDVLTYTWYSDIMGELGKSENVNSVKLTPGSHIIKVEVLDSYNLKTSANITVRVSAKSMSKPAGEDKGSDLNAVIAAVIILVVVLIVVIFMLLNKKKKAKDTEVDKTKVDEGIEK